MQIILKVEVMKIVIIETKVSGQYTVQMKSKLKKKDGMFEYSKLNSSTYSAKICLLALVLKTHFEKVYFVVEMMVGDLM